MNTTEQQFLNDLDKKLWNAADRLRSSLDAAVYKHIVLGLIFLKYASDAFEERRRELARKFRDPDDASVACKRAGGNRRRRQSRADRR